MLRDAGRWVLCLLVVALPLAAGGCSDSCDDAEEVCDECGANYKDSCNDRLNACEVWPEIGPGYTKGDCCDAVYDDFEDDC